MAKMRKKQEESPRVQGIASILSLAELLFAPGMYIVPRTMLVSGCAQLHLESEALISASMQLFDPDSSITLKRSK